MTVVTYQVPIRSLRVTSCFLSPTTTTAMADITLIVFLIIASTFLTVFISVTMWTMGVIPWSVKQWLKRLIRWTPTPPITDLESAHQPCIHCNMVGPTRFCTSNPSPPVPNLELTHRPCVHCNLRAPIQFRTSTSTNNAPLPATDQNTYPPIPVSSTQQALPSSYPSRISRSLQRSMPAATIMYPHQSPAQSCRLSTTSFDSAGSSHKYAYDTWGVPGWGIAVVTGEPIESTTPDTQQQSLAPSSQGDTLKDDLFTRLP